MDIIKELWYGNVAPFEQCTRGDKQLKELLKLVARNKEELDASLTEKQKDILPGSIKSIKPVPLGSIITVIIIFIRCLLSVQSTVRLQELSHSLAHWLPSPNYPRQR